MANPSKRKGTAGETAVVATLVEQGWPHAERRALSGAKDRGDVAGVPGIVIEVKNEREFHISAWLKEAATEKANDHADHGVVWFKIPRKGDPMDWAVCMTGAEFLSLLAKAGYR